MLLCYICYILDGFFMPFIDTHFLPMPRQANCPLKHAAHLIYGSAIAEIFSTRLYFAILHMKVGKDNLKWFRLVKDINKDEQGTLFPMSKLLFIGLYLSGTFGFVGTQMAKLFFERPLPINVAFNCVWTVNNILFIRFTVIDMPFLYMVTGSCYLRVRKGFHNLNSSVEKANEYINGQVVVPFFSVVIV